MNKKQMIYIGILVVLVIVFILTKIDTNVEKRIQFFQVDSTKVQTIEISNIKDTIRLSKKDDIWLLTFPMNSPARKHEIKNLFTSVLNAETSNLPISENERSFDKYKVTVSQGTKIKFLDENNNLLDEAIIGKNLSSGSTSARRPEEIKIYRLESNITRIVTTDANKWREKSILNIDENNITKISVIWENNAYELVPADSLWRYDDGKNSIGVDFNNKTLRDILTTLSKLKITNFVDDEYEKYEQKLQMPELEIGIELFDGTSHYLRIALDEDPKYVLQFDNSTDHLYSIYSNWVKKFSKEVMDFK